MMESIEKLRGLATDVNKSEIKDHDALYSLDQWLNAWHRAFGKALEALEREIAERYMELPVDAEGVPIRVGDELCGYGHPKGGVQVAMVSESCVIVREDLNHNPAKHGLLWAADETRHVKPRTVEDVLRDCCNEWNEHCGNDWEQGVFAKYADELRCMGVGE